jgi:hypothetical protein
MEKYYPEGDKNSSFNTCGYITAILVVVARISLLERELVSSAAGR